MWLGKVINVSHFTRDALAGPEKLKEAISTGTENLVDTENSRLYIVALKKSWFLDIFTICDTLI